MSTTFVRRLARLAGTVTVAATVATALAGIGTGAPAHAAASSCKINAVRFTLVTGDDDKRDDSVVSIKFESAVAKTVIASDKGERLADRTMVTSGWKKFSPATNSLDFTTITLHYESGPGGGFTLPDQWEAKGVRIEGLCPDASTTVIFDNIDLDHVFTGWQHKFENSDDVVLFKAPRLRGWYAGKLISPSTGTSVNTSLYVDPTSKTGFFTVPSPTLVVDLGPKCGTVNIPEMLVSLISARTDGGDGWSEYTLTAPISFDNAPGSYSGKIIMKGKALGFDTTDPDRAATYIAAGPDTAQLALKLKLPSGKKLTCPTVNIDIFGNAV